MFYCTFTDITINFNESTYIVGEDEGPAQPVLVLNNPSSTDITVVVTDSSGSGNNSIISILLLSINQKHIRRNG